LRNEHFWNKNIFPPIEKFDRLRHNCIYRHFRSWLLR
jgi:hypothetical protein